MESVGKVFSYRSLSDEDSSPTGGAFASISRSCSAAADSVVWVTGCQDDEWLSNAKAPPPGGGPRGRAANAVMCSEDEWRAVNRCIFFPVAPIKMSFDLGVMLCVVYSCISVPYRIAFGSEATGILYTFELVIQLVFLLDVLLNFNTAFQHGQLWVLHRPAIARNYLKGWFWVDAPACLPLLEVYIMLGSEDQATEATLLRAFRLFRLLRLLKMFKLGEAVRTIEYATGLNLKALQVLVTVIGVLAFTHLSACVFYALSLASQEAYDESWASAAFPAADDAGGEVESASPLDRYITSLLWAVGTVTGLNSPVAPLNYAERVCAVVLYLLAALLFALIVAVVTQQRLAYSNDPFNVRMAEVGAFCRFHRMPRGLQEKLQQFFESMYTNTSVVRDEELLARMTPSLQDKVWDHILASTVKRIALFANVGGQGGGKLARLLGDTRKFHIGALAYVTYSPSERLLPRDVLADTLFFLRRGEVYACGDEKRRLYSIETGQYFGERCCIEPPQAEAVDFDARTRCDIFCLAKADLLRLVATHLVPDQRMRLAEDVRAEMLRKGAVHIEALKSLAGDGTAESDAADEAAELTESLSELQGTSAVDLLPALAGDGSNEDDTLQIESKRRSIGDVKVSGARIGHKTGGMGLSFKGGGGSSGGTGLEDKVEALQEAVNGMRATLEQLASGQAELMKKVGGK